MSNLPETSGPVNPEPDGPQKIKHTLIWDSGAWLDIERAAALLSAKTGAEVTVPNYIRGTVELRNREILAGQAA